MVTATRINSIPSATYDPQLRQASVSNAFPIKDVLRAGGYTWRPFSKTWKRTGLSLEDFITDWLLLKNIGVELDEATAELVKKATEPEKPAAVAEPEKPAQDDKAIPPKADRRENARLLVESGAVKPNRTGSGYYVRAQSAGPRVWYFVPAGATTCTCQDERGHQLEGCKHMLAVRMYQERQSSPAAVATETPAPETTPAEPEGWSAIAPPSVDKLRKAREKAILLANAELPGRKGMRVPDAADREMLGEIAGLLREVLAEVA